MENYDRHCGRLFTLGVLAKWSRTWNNYNIRVVLGILVHMQADCRRVKQRQGLLTYTQKVLRQVGILPWLDMPLRADCGCRNRLLCGDVLVFVSDDSLYYQLVHWRHVHLPNQVYFQSLQSILLRFLPLPNFSVHDIFEGLEHFHESWFLWCDFHRVFGLLHFVCGYQCTVEYLIFIRHNGVVRRY